MESLEYDDPTEIGPYRLIARLGAGGMGRVYLARSAGGRTVAVKVVRAELAGDPDFRARFRREVAAAQAVDGAYTAPVVDADRDSATPWLATAYVLGPSLAEAVARYGPLPEDSVRTLGAVLAQALVSVHASGLVHRDLKPSNVLLAADGPRLIDFGIARALDAGGLTSTGVIVGSPGFMSPEQAAGRRTGTEGDVFSLGSVLVFAATGNGPFGNDSAASMLYRVVHEQPDLEGLPQSLADTLLAALAKDPAQRPAPAELARQLAPEGPQALLAAGWLPHQVASGIARHAAQVMEMETPAPHHANGRQGSPGNSATGAAPGADPGTVRLGTAGTATANGAAHSPTVVPQAPASPARRRLLFGALGVAGVAAVGGGTALALSSGKPGKHVTTTTSPSASGTAHPSPTPSTAPSRAAGVPPQPLWTFSGSSLQLGPVLIGGDRVYVFGDTSTALDPGTGRVLWTGPNFAPGNMFASAASLAAGYLIGRNAGTGALFGLDPATGGQAWNLASLDGYYFADLLATDATTAYLLATKSQNSFMVAVDLKSRTLRWAQPRNAAADYEVAGAVAAGYLVYTNDKGNVVVRGTGDGRQLWSKDFTGAYPGQPVYPLIEGSTLYVEGSTVLGFHLADGRQVFSAKAPQGDSYLLPLAAGGRLIVQDTDGGQVVALNGSTGAVAWQAPMKFGLLSTAAVAAGDNLFVGSDYANADGGGLYAFTQSGGHQLWNFQDGQAKDWYLSTDGTTVFAVHGDKVYALPRV